MKIVEKKIFLLLLVISKLINPLMSQDLFFYETNHFRSLINPALTGINGSLSLNLVGKEQLLNTLDDFTSGGVSIEQSWPCARIDGGLFHVYDKEGDGFLQTNHTAANFVYTLPFKLKRNLNNIRFGTKIQYTSKQINWDELVFTDQIDPKYNLTNSLGIPNTTDFVAPVWNRISRLTLGVGMVHKTSIGYLRRNSITWGLAVENYTGLFENKGYDSFLKIPYDNSSLVNKLSFFFAPEISLTKSYFDYIGFRPCLIVLKESSLKNWQLGFDVNYRRSVSFGFFLSSGGLDRINKDNKYLIFSSSVQAIKTRKYQINLSLQYCHNVGGFSEVFGQSIQLNIGFVFKQDGCSGSPDTSADCPSISYRKDIIYDNVWFSPIGGINK